MIRGRGGGGGGEGGYHVKLGILSYRTSPPLFSSALSVPILSSISLILTVKLNYVPTPAKTKSFPPIYPFPEVSEFCLYHTSHSPALPKIGQIGPINTVGRGDRGEWDYGREREREHGEGKPFLGTVQSCSRQCNTLSRTIGSKGKTHRAITTGTVTS